MHTLCSPHHGTLCPYPTPLPPCSCRPRSFTPNDTSRLRGLQRHAFVQAQAQAAWRAEVEALGQAACKCELEALSTLGPQALRSFVERSVLSRDYI
jgi:hypothetical protein